MPEMSSALYVGRFQPFHKGHLHAVSHILERETDVTIVVGSALTSHEEKNPFTAGERIEMIAETLDSRGIDGGRYWLVPVPDVELHSTWTAYVESLCPEFDSVYSNEPLTRTLFEERGRDVESIPFLRREVYSGREFRRRVRGGEEWEELVPEAVSDFLEDRKLLSRVEVAKKDDYP